MGSIISRARQMAAGRRSRVVISNDSISHTRKSWSLFRSSERKVENKAHFGKFLTLLQQDPKYRHVDNLAETAFAELNDKKDTGKPLSSRMMRKAYQKADALLAKHQEKLDSRKYLLLSHAKFQLNQHLDLHVARATDLGLASLSRKLDLEQHRQLTSLLLEGIEHEIDELNRDDRSMGSFNEFQAHDLADQVIGRALRKQAGRLREIAATVTAKTYDVESEHQAGRLKPVIDTIKDFSAKRLNAKLFSSAGANFHFEQQVMRDMGDRLAKKTNSELLDLYRTTVSTDMLQLRLALANRPDDRGAQSMLEDLNSFEAMVHMEVAERTAAGTLGPQLSGRQMGVLADTELRSSKRELVYQSDDYLKCDPNAQKRTDPLAGQKLQDKGVDVRQVTGVLHAADLTINLSNDLFHNGGPFFDPTGQIKEDNLGLKNIFELPENTKAKGYLQRRQTVEDSLFPKLNDKGTSSTQPKDRPISSAVNVGRSQVGGAPGSGYGHAVIVLKDNVKKRSTYTPSDTFFTYEAHITRDGKEKFAASVRKLIDENKLSDQAKQELTGNNNGLAGILGKIDNAVDQHFGLGHEREFEAFVGDDLFAGLNLKDDDKSYLMSAAIDAFIDKQDPANHVVSQERFEQLLQHVADDDLKTIAKGIQDPKRINLRMGNYIEAQVHGGIDLAKDVKEIHVPDYDRVALRNARKLGQKYGIKVIPMPLGQMLPERLDTDSSYARPIQPPEKTRMRGQSPNLQHFKQHHLPGILDRYKDHEQSFDPSGIHGRRHISRSLIYSNVMANMMRAKGATIDSHTLYTTTALHDSARQGNGVDRWEKDSAKQASNYVKEQGASEVQDERYLEMVEATIDSQSEQVDKTLEAGILKSADSLDIQRVFGRDGYKKDLLWFMHQDTKVAPDTYLEVDETERDQLIDEAAKLIERTEPTFESEKKLNKAREEMNDLLATGDDYDAIEDKQKQIRQLGQEAYTDHTKWNSERSSQQIFNDIERELLQHPQDYPLLSKYYAPENG